MWKTTWGVAICAVCVACNPDRRKPETPSDTVATEVPSPPPIPPEAPAVRQTHLDTLPGDSLTARLVYAGEGYAGGVTGDVQLRILDRFGTPMDSIAKPTENKHSGEMDETIDLLYEGIRFRIYRGDREFLLMVAATDEKYSPDVLRIGTVARSTVEVRFGEPEDILTFADTTFLRYSEPGAELPIYVYIEVLRDTVTGIVWRYPVD